MSKRIVICLVSLALSFACLSSHAGPEVQEEDQAVSASEASSGNQLLLEQRQQIEDLQQELSGLQEKLEVQEHEQGKEIQGRVEPPASSDAKVEPENNATISAPEKRLAPWVMVSPKPEPLQQTKTATLPQAAIDGFITLDVHGSHAYKVAFSLLMEGRYKQAVIAYGLLLQRYPESKYIDQGHFWLGEANYLLGNYSAALGQFQIVANKYPRSIKKPVTDLKIGLINYEAKNWALARSSLQRVVENHPHTVVAQKAKLKLQSMEKQQR